MSDPPQRNSSADFSSARSNNEVAAVGGGWFGNNMFDPFQRYPPQPRWRRQTQPAVREDFSKAPPPVKHDTVPQRQILVLGDAMADWLAYGVEDAYADQTEIGIIRKHETVSGLIKYQPKGDPADWATAAKGILATEKPDVIVIMLGLNDRVAMREPAVDKSDSKSSDKKPTRRYVRKAKPDAKSADGKAGAKPGGSTDATAKRDDKPVYTELSPEDAANNDGPPGIAPEEYALVERPYEFRDERWVELYNRKIDQMIGVLKSEGVPVLWVGLPAIRGPKATSDTLFLIRSTARTRPRPVSPMSMSAMDLSTRPVPLCSKVPTSRARSAGCARTTAYTSPRPAPASLRILSSATSRGCWPRAQRRSRCRANRERPTPIRCRVQPATRPLAGPILPLVASSVGTDQLLGGHGSRPVANDALATRVLVKGEPLPAPAGRADDFAWPRREVGHEQVKGEPPSGIGIAQCRRPGNSAAASPKPKKHRSWRWDGSFARSNMW